MCINNLNISKFPASAIQQQFWFESQSFPKNSAHNIPSLFFIDGKLKISLLNKSLNTVISRHPTLRYTFTIETGIVFQNIKSKLNIDITVLDISHQEDKNVHEQIKKEAIKPFDLENGPLIRAHIFKTEENKHYFLITMHHIVTDLFSKDLLGSELSETYNCLITGHRVTLENTVMQYTDYSISHEKWLRGEQCKSMLSYWKKTLQGKSDLLDLPYDFIKPPIKSLKGDAEAFSLTKSFTESLKTFSRNNNVNIYLTLLTTYFILLHKYSMQSDITVGVPLSNRRNQDFKNVMGCFVSILPISVNFSSEPDFLQLLKQVRTLMLHAHRNQEVPLKTTVEALHLKRDAAYNPLFQTGFTFEHPMKIELNGAVCRSRPIHCGGSQLDLFPVLWESEEGIKGHFEYRTDLFEKTTIERLINHYKNLLQEVMDNHKLPVSQLPILSNNERDLLIHSWNNTTKKYPEEDSIHILFEKQVEKTPDTIALSYNQDTLTYKALNKRANKLAHFLTESGIKSTIPVGLFMERSLEMVISIYGIMKAGGAYVPLDPDYPKDRLSYMIEDTKITVILTQHHLVPKTNDFKANIISIDSCWSDIERCSDLNPVNRTNLDDPAYIIYTSGSTGKPKGVINSHRGICNRILWMQDEYNLRESDNVLQKTPYSFDVSVWEFFWPLLFGAKLVIAPPESHKDPASLVNIINDNKITTIHFVPSMLQVFLENHNARTCHYLKRVICSGEALSNDLQDRFFSTIDTELHNLYGPTEAAVDVTYWQCRPQDINNKQMTSVPIGKPVSNTQIYILDKYLEPVPVGVPGELHIGGVQISKGYLNRPELNKETFVSDPFSDKPNAKLYKTGDLARFRPDGNVEYIGRLDFQVKVRGFRIELGEIESEINTHPGISQSVVIIKDFGQSDKRIIAYMVPDNTNSYTVRQHLVMNAREDHLKFHELPNGMNISHLNTNETTFMYQEIFKNRSYIKHGISLNDNDCVFDVGANIGMFSLFAANSANNVTIYSFEPIPPVFNTLKTNTDLYNFNIKPFQLGLSDKPSTEEFTHYPHFTILSGRYANFQEEKKVVEAHILNELNGSSQKNDISNDILDDLLTERLKSETYTCTLKTISQIIKEQGITIIDLLKIDVEKSEYEVLTGIDENDWKKIHQICIEIHDNGGNLARIKNLLSNKNYNISIDKDDRTGLCLLYAIHRNHISAVHNTTKKRDRTNWYNPSELKEDVKKELQKKLPNYMIPSLYILLDEIPLTQSGKVNRKVLPEPDINRQNNHAEYIAPQSDIEKMLSKLWADILKINKVSIHDNFFDIGGNSLLGVSLISKIQEKSGKEIPIVKLFQYPTIKSFSIFFTSENKTNKPLLKNVQKRARLRKRSIKRRSAHEKDH